MKTVTIVCVGCSTTFTYAQRTKLPQYCSEECCNRRRRRAPLVADCRVCKKPFDTGGGGQSGRPKLYCGKKCYRRANYDHAPRSKVSFPTCHECDRVYCGRRGPRSGEITVCPDVACQRLAHNRRMRKCLPTRRARKLDAFIEYVDRQQVFEHDGYRCHLCRRKTLRTKQVPHPRAPTIDHIVPLSRGGKHEYVNCRTACFLCNAQKNAYGGGEQLLLIA